MDDQARLLVVEDHYETATFLELTLSDTYDVTIASSADEALQKADQHHYDLLLIDIALREEATGVDLVGWLRERPDYADVPMIATTAQYVDEKRCDYLGQGFDEFLPKPYYPEDLMELIEELLANYRARPHGNGSSQDRPGS